MANMVKKITVAHVNDQGDKLVQHALLENSLAHLFDMNASGKLAVGLKSFFDVMEGIAKKNDWVREQLKVDVVRNKSIQSAGQDQLMFIICSSDSDVIAHSYKKLLELSKAFALNDSSVTEYLNKTSASQQDYTKLIHWLIDQDYDRIIWSNFEEMCINDFDTIGQFMKLYVETVSLLDEYSLFEMYGASSQNFEFEPTLTLQKRIVLF